MNKENENKETQNIAATEAAKDIEVTFEDVSYKKDNPIEYTEELEKDNMYLVQGYESPLIFVGVSTDGDINFSDNEGLIIPIKDSLLYEEEITITPLIVKDLPKVEKKLSTEDVLSVLNDDGLKHIENLAKNKNKKELDKFFKTLKQVNHYLENGIDDKTIIDDIMNKFDKSLNSKLNKLNAMSKDNEKNEIKVNDLISVPGEEKGKYIKGKVTDISDDSFVIETKNDGKLKVSKEGALKFYPRQKFDIREVVDLFEKTQKQLKFSDLSKKDQGAILRGEETSVIKGRSKVTDEAKEKEALDKGVEYVPELKDFTFKLSIKKDENGLKVNRVFGAKELDIKNTKIYGVPVKDQLSKEQLKDLSEGKEAVMTFKNGKKEEYKRSVYVDKDLNKVRSKPLSKEQKEDIKAELTPVNKEEQKKKKGRGVS